VRTGILGAELAGMKTGLEIGCVRTISMHCAGVNSTKMIYIGMFSS
jgi:hypothetical protein